MNNDLKPLEIDKLVESNGSLAFDNAVQERMNQIRQGFRDYFRADKIRGLGPDEYFQGRGIKDGNFTYELEWKTRDIGSIRGGSNFKFGYERDFDRIKGFILYIVTLPNQAATFYGDSGTLTAISQEMVQRSKGLKGLKTGRTAIGKILSIYFPEVFINIFVDQEHFLGKIYSDYEVESKGLDYFLVNNYLLLQVRARVLSVLPDAEATALTNDRFAHLLYKTYPKVKSEASSTGEAVIEETPEEPVNALEVQHYQTLVHRNFRRLFPGLRYYDEAAQNEVYGHYDTEEIGVLDFLALDDSNDLVVIELKRRASDQTLGQLLRYMGWVKENLCEEKQRVKGLILAESMDLRLKYALNVVSGVEVKKIRLDIEIE
jgi:hypothetical protein